MEDNALMKLVVMGAPGVGKGTYTKLLSKRYKLPHISTGDMFREEIKKGRELGKLAKEIIDKGNLVPDDITTNMLKKRLKKSDCGNGFILDGYPRNIQQAKSLENITNIDKVINFVAPDEVITNRVSGRIICKKCGAIYHIKNIPPKKQGICDACGGELYQREDDNPESVKIRLKIYHEKTALLIEYYKKKGLLADVDVSSPYKEYMKVLKQVDKALGIGV